MQSGEDSHVFPLFYFSYHNSGCCYEVRAVKAFQDKSPLQAGFCLVITAELILENKMNFWPLFNTDSAHTHKTT